MGVAILWGGTWPAGSIVAANIPAFSSALWRFILASILMFVWVKYRQSKRSNAVKPSPLTAKQWLAIIFAGFLGVTLYATFFMLALERVPAGRSALFITLTPAVITVLAAWWFKEPFNKWVLIGVIAAVVGAMIVISHGHLSTFSLATNRFGWGELFLMGCVFSWAGYSLLGKVIMTYGNSFRITTYSIIAGTFLLLPVAWLIDGIVPNLPMTAGIVERVDSAWQVWLALAYLAVLGTALGYAWFFQAVDDAGAGTAASYISLVPIFGVFFSWLLLDEQLDWTIWFGGGLAVTGVFVIAWAKSKLVSG